MKITIEYDNGKVEKLDAERALVCTDKVCSIGGTYTKDDMEDDIAELILNIFDAYNTLAEEPEYLPDFLAKICELAISLNYTDEELKDVSDYIVDKYGQKPEYEIKAIDVIELLRQINLDDEEEN